MNTKTDNQSAAKSELRRWLLRKVKAEGLAGSVLDLYCGESGKMWRDAWCDSPDYLGIDHGTPHKFAPTIKMSAERAIGNIGRQFDIIDIDPYCNPWPMLEKSLKIEGVRGIALTVCDGRTLKNGHCRGVYPFIPNTPLAYRYAEDIYLTMLKKCMSMCCKEIDDGLYYYLQRRGHFYAAFTISGEGK